MKIYKYKLCGPEELIGQSVGGGLSVLGAYMTNKTNKEIAEANNATMLKAMREQTASEQRYNSMAEQMKRAMYAGVHPLLMAGAGANPSTASASSVPSLDTPIMQNPFQGMESVGSAMANSFLRSKEISLQDESLDVSRINSKIDLIKSIAELSKNSELSSSDINTIIKSVMDSDPEGVQLGSFYRDHLVNTRINNAIRNSNVDTDTKEYLFGWLDEMQNAEYVNLLADTEQKKTQSNVNRSISSLNGEKQKEVQQAIKNMQEQWKSLNFQGELDVNKLKRVVEISDNLADKISFETKVSKQDAKFYVWKMINQTISPLISAAGNAIKAIL